MKKMFLFLALFLLFSTVSCNKYENTSSQQTSIEYKYVGSINSNKYHYPSCKWAKEIHSKNMVKFKDRDDAKARGYVPCKVCKP